MRVAVLGAGMAGLAAGYRLTAEGHEADVYERWPGLGGQAAIVDVGGAEIERYYHHLFTSDEEIHALCREIGIPDELKAWPSSVAMFSHGKLWPFTTPMDLLRYKPMSLLGRLRMGVAVVYLQKRLNDVRPLEPLTIKEWVDKYMGKEAWTEIWGPMLRGKFGDQAADISMSWLWAKLRNRRAVTGEEAKGELLVYPKGSFEAIFQRLQHKIEEGGGRVLIDRPAQSVARDEDGSFLVTSGSTNSFRKGHDPRDFEPAGEPERYDAVLATVPSDIFEQVLAPELKEQVDPEYFRKTNDIEYFAALCMVLELDRKFHDFYWTNVADEDMRFIGLIEHTNLVGPEHYGGRHFLYVANYLPHDHELLKLDFDQLLDVYEPGLRKVNPAFSRDWIKQHFLFKEPAGQPVVLRNYPSRMPPYETGVPGLLMANTTQVYPDDRGTNYAVREADEVVRTLLAQPEVLRSSVSRSL